ncbi:diacylglycerol kinase family protein [Tessaracoccus caeni]|uniref:diacylglycerol kinase family protein n=1 Tax=Tessaracoccus caeni TaxID=3031239 RepID=UPI0023D98A48|nr:diacylglycerol kinase family protein [Tessaracoccus caeni]MDF1489925.1 diacylglycerol kinase family protein [Tessaracoccus caeni]
MTTRVRLIAIVILGVAMATWVALWPHLGAVDAWWRWAPPAERSNSGQIWSAIALFTSPVVVYTMAAFAAIWAARRRLFAASASIVLTSVLTASITQVMKELVHRPRADSPWAYLLSQTGWSFPSGHVSAWTAVAVAVVTLSRVAGQSKRMVWAWRGVALGSVAVVMVCRLTLHAHYVTDVIGGALLALLVATSSNLLCGVHAFGGRRGDGARRAGVIFNPAKIVDLTVFKQLLETALAENGWGPPIYLPTSPDDPGHAMARHAVRIGVDRVLIAGGDGTVRVALGELAGTGVEAAIIPSGTANLLAQNLGIPFDLSRSLRLALRGEPRPLDLIKVTSPERRGFVEYAGVLAGIGADAAVISNTNEELKRQIGTAAYVVAALNQVKTHPMDVLITVDDEHPIRRAASLVSVGNVADLQPGLTLIPGASTSDGILDLLIASPRNVGDVVEMIGGVLTQSKNEPRIDRFTGRTVHVETAEPALCQIDGDVVGEFRHLDFHIVPGAVPLAQPKESSQA